MLSTYCDEEPAPETALNSWDSDAEDLHKRILERVPGLFRKIAARNVAGEIAGKANGGKVSRELVLDGWRSATPGPFKKEVEGIIKELTQA